MYPKLVTKSDNRGRAFSQKKKWCQYTNKYHKFIDYLTRHGAKKEHGQ